MAVGLVYDPLYLEHDTGSHPENASRLTAILSLLQESGLAGRLERIQARDATVEELTAVHALEMVDFVRAAAGRGGAWADPDTYISTRSYEAALRAAGGCLAAVDAVMTGAVESAFCLVRPPGHHATPLRPMGFCLFNNVAVAALYARGEHRLGRVAIVDFDVHHGNGIQDTFYDDPSVLYFSCHQYPFYPGTGHFEEAGEGPGEGYTVNVPLLAGAGDDVLHDVWERILGPVLRRFAAELILVSAGYDAHFADPLAGLNFSVGGYWQAVARLRQWALELCGGRLVLALEGGYDPMALPWSVRATLEALLRQDATPDPLGRLEARRPAATDDVLSLVAKRHKLAHAT